MLQTPPNQPPKKAKDKPEWSGVYSLDCIRLFDGSVSIRIDDEEIVILPPKELVTADDLERALRRVAMEIDDIWLESFDPPPPKRGGPDW